MRNLSRHVSLGFIVMICADAALTGCEGARSDELASREANACGASSMGNLALGKPTTSSSVETTAFAPARAVDGDGSSRWSSAFSDAQWIAVDLGARYAINRVVLKWETAFGRDYEVQVSDDGNAWASVYSTKSGDGGVDDIGGLTATGRYVRMLGHARATQWGYSLFELEVYGDDAASAPPPSAPPSSPPITGPSTVARDASGFAKIDGKSRFLKIAYDATNNGASYASETIPARHFENYAFDVVLNYFLGTQDNAIKTAAALRSYGMYTVAIGNATGGYPISAGSGLQLVDDAAFRAKWAATPGALGAYLADEPEDSVQSNVLQWQGTYKSSMPNIATISILLQSGFHQAEDWASKNTGDWLGIDPYPYIGLESYPLKGSAQSEAPSTYGWSLDYIAEGAANLTKYTRQYGKTAIVINQLFKGFWGAERLPNRCELWAQAVMPIVEGANGIGWWALGSSYDGALHSSSVSDAERAPVEAELGKITKLLATLEPTILSTPDPAKLAFNSTTHASGDPKAWRLEALHDYLATWPAGYDKPFYLLYSDYSSWWGAEKAALESGDTSKSYMLDQASYVRTRVFEAPDGTGYVFAYNHRPSHYPAVTFRWYRPVSHVEDLTTGETYAIGSDGASWSAGFGGSSTKRENGLQTARIFRITP